MYPCIDARDHNIGDVYRFLNTTITIDNKNLTMGRGSNDWAGMNPVQVNASDINSTYKNTNLVTPLSKSCKFFIRYQ